jgi:phosphoserine phosphatase
MRADIHRGSEWLAALTLTLGLLLAAIPGRAEPLPSWRDGQAKRTILEFVARVTQEGGPDFVAPEARIATFDNDGTLWAEQPTYFQVAFVLDRVRVLAADHPEWKETPPFAAVLARDRAALAKLHKKEILELFAASHAGITSEEFLAQARAWLSTTPHPRFGKPYREVVYLPMLELLEYLRAHGFKTFIVSGGGIEFIRAFAEDAYGIPPEQVVGSSLRERFELRGGRGVLVKLPELGSLNDKAEKPVNINLHLGRRPILAFGNSDGDLEMLQYTTTGEGPRLGLVLHHDDAEREWAYDRASSIGRLDKALDEAAVRGWTVVSIQKDFRRVFAFAGE